MSRCPGESYLHRQPESLVVGGYRGVVDCAIKGDTPLGHEAVRALEEMHLRHLGPAESRVVIDGLSSFIGTLSRCATCPLRAFPVASSHICRDECLLLGLVAALQHGDDQAGQLCASALTCPARMAETFAASSDYAMRMKMFGQVLLPIPHAVLSHIVSGHPSPTHQASRTIH